MCEKNILTNTSDTVWDRDEQLRKCCSTMAKQDISGRLLKEIERLVRGGPLPVVSRVVTPYIGVTITTPVTHV